MSFETGFLLAQSGFALLIVDRRLTSIIDMRLNLRNDALSKLMSLLKVAALITSGAMAPLVGNSQNFVVNGSFEQPGYASDDYTAPFRTMATNGVAGWYFGPSGVTGHNYDGITSSAANSLCSGNVEDGTNAAFVQGGVISQMVQLNTGAFTLSFWAMGRVAAGNGANPVAVTIGNFLAETVTPQNTAQNVLSDWTQYAFYFNVPSNGAYPLTFQATIPYNPTDQTTFIDHVAIVALAAATPTIISEPYPQEILFAGQTAQFAVQASGYPAPSYQWQFETNGIYVNLTNNGRIFGATSPCLTISNLNLGDATNYLVQASNSAGFTNSTSVSLTVQPAPSPGSPRAFVTVINPSFEDGQQSGDTYTTPFGSLNPESGIPGWQFNSSANDSYSGIVTETGGTFGSPKYIPQGWQAAFIQGTGRFLQSVTFNTGGMYVIRFRAEGRSNGGAGAETVALQVDGNTVGTFTPLTTQWMLYTSLLFNVAAGVHVISFTGTVPYSQSDRTSFIDAVQIVTPAEAVAALPPTSPVYDIVFVGDSITYGATLADPGGQSPPPQFVQSTGQRFNASVNVSNQGHSGFTTVDWLPTASTGAFQQALNAAASLEAGQPGQLIFSIMLGANDSAQSGTDGAPVSAANYQKNLQIIIDRFLTNYPSALVFIHYPIWYSTNTHNGALYGPAGAALLKTYLPQINVLVASNAFLHPGQVFVGDTQAYGCFETNHLTLMTPESGVDGTFYLHPNAAGAVALAKFWADAIAQALSFATNSSYTAWLQSGDLTPGLPGAAFSDRPTNSLVPNGVAYANPNGLFDSVSPDRVSINVNADIRNDSTLTAILQTSSDLLNWSPVSWSLASDQAGAANGFVRYSIQNLISGQNQLFYELKLSIGGQAQFGLAF